MNFDLDLWILGYQNKRTLQHIRVLFIINKKKKGENKMGKITIAISLILLIFVNMVCAQVNAGHDPEHFRMYPSCARKADIDANAGTDSALMACIVIGNPDARIQKLEFESIDGQKKVEVSFTRIGKTTQSDYF